MEAIGKSVGIEPWKGSVLTDVERLARRKQECTLAASRLLGCYPKGEASDPETFQAAMAAIFSRFPGEVVAEVSDPVHGLPSLLKWFPSLAEVREHCERVSARITGEHRRAWELKRQLAESRQRDLELALGEPRPGERLTYEQAVASGKKIYGRWDPQNESVG